jgi:hypothetical protein
VTKNELILSGIVIVKGDDGIPTIDSFMYQESIKLNQKKKEAS